MSSLDELKDICIGKLQELRENLGTLELVGIGALVLIILAGAAVMFLRDRTPPVPVVKEIREERPVQELKIHVAGAVVRPGVYEFNEGKRVLDAIQQAGGSLPEANLDALNLAGKLVDGQKVLVPRKGDAAPMSSLSGEGGTVPLNLATVEQLDELPGIGEVLARRIVEWREAHGRFNKLEELMEVEGIGAKKYEQLRGKLTLD